MGCFSWLCKKCGKAILSDSFSGDPVELFLLENGKVVEHLSGQYDSYGRVFTKDLEDCIKWSRRWTGSYPDEAPDQTSTAVCDLISNENKGDGIAAIHTSCYDGIPPDEISEHDPNQGWGTPEDESDDDEFIIDDEEERDDDSNNS